SKLTHDDDARVAVEAALMQVLDEGAHALVEDREVLAFALEDRVVRPAVPVPLAVVERDNAGAGFHEPPGHEQALRDAWSAVVVHEDLRIAGSVALHHARVFFRQVESVGQPRGGEQPESLLIEMIHALELAGRLDVTTQAIEAPEQCFAVAEPVHGDAA